MGYGMRHLSFIIACMFGAFLAAACSVWPPQSAKLEPAAGPVVLPVVVVRAEKEEAEKPLNPISGIQGNSKQRVKVSSGPSPCSHLPRGIDATDEIKARDEIRAKLDCIEKHTR